MVYGWVCKNLIRFFKWLCIVEVNRKILDFFLKLIKFGE